MIPKHDHAAWGWAAIGAVVAIADATGERTMSNIHQEIAKHPVGGPALAIGWTVLLAHLFGLLDPKYDPFHRVGCRRCIHAR